MKANIAGSNERRVPRQVALYQLGGWLAVKSSSFVTGGFRTRHPR